jgi:hypothetical protein
LLASSVWLHPLVLRKSAMILLEVGDQLKTLSDRIEQIKSIEFLTKDIEVYNIEGYNIEVGNNHNYFITGSSILVHNKNITEQKQGEFMIKKKRITK